MPQLICCSLFSCSVVSDSLWLHEPQHTRPPCPSLTLGVYTNPCPLSRWCHPTISSSVDPFSSCPQSFPASGSFQMSPLFASGGQSIGASVSSSVLPMNIQDWFPLGLTGMISLQSIYRLSVNVNNYVCLIKFVGMILVNLCQGHNNNKLYFKGYYFLGKFSFVGSFSTFPHFIYWVWYFKDTYYYYVYLPYLLASHWSALSFTYI